MKRTDMSAKKTVPNRNRYRRTLLFFAGLISSLVGWEIVLRRLLGSRFVTHNRPERLARYAREFRSLAVEMGGVMIKLGQFFSARVDVLPPEITKELSGLQDEVPPVPYSDLRPLIEHELGPPTKVFREFDHQPQAAASLGQVYKARLHNGDRVVVKIQRPGIEDLVATDLAALDVVGKWLMKYRPIRRRANIPDLLDEFARTLWDELDYVKEAANAERFAEIFSDDPEVRIPSVCTEFCTERILILEDVTSIKITDHATIDEAGIDRREVAMRLFRLYMDQIFEHRFFHADPHPGNLFVHPLPQSSRDPSVSADDETPSRPFELVFVDFGMVGNITDNVLAGLREALLAVGTRDMRRLVHAYQTLGVLLPQADLDRIAQAEQQIFDRLWGMNMREMVDFSYQEATEIAREFRDLVYEMPFQVPQNLIYVGRALGILSGMCTNLDPEFNPWTALAPYAQRMVEEELRMAPSNVLEALRRFGRLLLALPRFAEGVIEKIESGQLEIRTSPTSEALRQQRHLAQAIDRVSQSIVFAALAGASTLLWLNGQPVVGAVGYALTGLSFIWLLRGFANRG